MRNESSWRHTKFTTKQSVLVPSRDPAELAVYSRLTAWLIADYYNRALPQHASGRLLDLGCGKQPFFGAYRDLVTAVTAVDWPSSRHVSTHIDVYCDLSAPLPFADGAFDTVLCSDVLEHLPDPELAFTEIARVLAPGGCLLLNAPFLYIVHEEPHDYLRHTRYSLERLCQLAELEVVEIVELGGALDVLFDLASKFLTEVPLIGKVLARLIQAIATSTRHRWLMSGARRRTAARFPAAHALVARRVMS